MNQEPLPLYFENRHLKIYGSLLERIGATLLDGIFMIPLILIIFYFNSQSLYNYYYIFLFTNAIVAAYTIYLPVRYGATPGKQVAGLTILKRDGSAITYRESFLKYLPALLMALFSFAVQVTAITNANPDVYASLDWIKQQEYLKSVNPFPMWLQLTVIYGFYVGNLFAVGLNKRNRSIGDLLAGTVVVKTAALDKIEAYQEGREF